MARLARVVIPGLPHHVTQRGNRREAIFFESGDHEIYIDMLAEQTLKAGVEVWAYCLMPNHVHLILKPTPPDARWARQSSSPASKPCWDARSNAALQTASQFPQLISPNS
jgi:REP element-mobilizing transposase RayT